MDDLRSLVDLLDLQTVDLDIDRLIERRQGLPELERYRAAHAEVERLTAEKTTADQEARTIDLDLDKTNGELELAEAKAEQEQNRLYAGGLSARDADYMRREVEMLKAQVATMEDGALELMEAREQATIAGAALAEQLAAVATEKETLEGSIKDSWHLIDAEIGVKEHRKAEIVPLVEVDLLDLYENLRETRQGAVVGELRDGVCGVCHLRLSAAEEAAARRLDPPRCNHCRAVLVP